MNDIKKIIYDCLTKEEEITYYTDEEQAEKDRLEQEIESNRPLTDKEKITLLENALLDIAEIQSTEYENRVMLENAVLELANLLGNGDEI